MAEDRVVISAHNPTMRTALRLVALTAPYWAVYVPGLFLGIYGLYIHPIFFDQTDRIIWLLGPFALGISLTCLLLSNTLILRKERIEFPPLKAANLPINDVISVKWYWDALEREIYLRFSLANRELIDIHRLRLTPDKLVRLQDAMKRFNPACEFLVHPEDLEDPIALRERFYKPKQFTLLPTTSQKTTDSIDIEYHPHEKYAEFLQSLGANEKYFWYCWMTVLLVPCIARIPDIVWGIIADLRHVERFVNVPEWIDAIDALREWIWSIALKQTVAVGTAYFEIAAHPFVVCILLAMAITAIASLGLFICQPNRIALVRHGLRLSLVWHKLVFYNAVYKWEDMLEFQLDQFGDDVNPEKWRMQIVMRGGHKVHLMLSSIKGTQARETLLRTITQMAPNAKQDPDLIRALLPPQKESYTELWLQSLTTAPKRSRLTPLEKGQKIKNGRYLVQRQLAVGGQGVAYVARDLQRMKSVDSIGETASADGVVLKEFVLPVYTSRAVRKQALERFENEARILRQLSHPQVVKLIDYFLEDHRAYLVLEHIDGVSLRKLVQERGALTHAECEDLAKQMCTVLEYLHGQEPPVVHRDFTPDNLILTNDGKLVLIDFNVAQQRQWTATGTVVGKHAYLPAEQFRGTPCPQSDLYAMGATLYFLATGKDPEPLSTSILPESTENGASTALRSVVSKLTAVELPDRYECVADVLHDLGAPAVMPAANEDTRRNTINTGDRRHRQSVHARKIHPHG